MIRLPSWWPFRSAEPSPESTVAPDDLRVIHAFNHGYLLAMSEGLKQIHATLFDRATTEALKRLDSVVEERAKSLGYLNPRPLLDLMKKQEEFRAKQSAARSPAEHEKYTRYLEALEWSLHANSVHSD